MTDLPIRVRGPMISALLDGKKTQDRQVLKPQPEPLSQSVLVDKTRITKNSPVAMFRWHSGLRQDVKLPYAIGDRLWVQETFTKTQYDDPVYRSDARDSRGHRWSSITPGDPDNEVLWKPSTQMPRWASRITLIVTDVRVQRLQDISEDDAIAEGCRPFFDQDNPVLEPCPNGEAIEMHPLKGPLEDFRVLWNGLHGDDAWSLNPWVVTITFTVHRGNIGQVSA